MGSMDDLAARLAKAAEGPVRPPASPHAGKAVRARNRRIRAYFQSVKNAASMPCTSDADQQFMYLLEADRSVRAYDRDPHTVNVRIGETLHAHVVGFAIHLERSTVLVDIGPADEGGTSAEVLGAVRDHFAETRVPYAIMPRSELRIEPRLSNAKALVQAGVTAPDPAFLLELTEAVSLGARTLGDLEAALGRWEGARQLIYAAALRGKVQLDLSGPLASTTSLSL
ncbi:hypothetical protein [Azospirillum sp. sgz301742]